MISRKQLKIKKTALTALMLLMLAACQMAEHADALPGTKTPVSVSATGQYWSFENYSFSFHLPEAMEGHYYPDPRMAHGVVFPLGLQQRPDERREILIWARHNTLNLSHDDLKEELYEIEWLKEIDPAVRKERIYFTTHTGLKFACVVFSGKSIVFTGAVALGREGKVIYHLSLLSTLKNWHEDFALFRQVFATFRPEASPIKLGITPLSMAMAGLYNSPEAEVRVLAYFNSLRLPHYAHLESELRARLRQTTSLIEQYIIKYVLASITHYEGDFVALIQHVAPSPAVVAGGSAAVFSVSGYFLEDLYPWMVHNNIHPRDAWLRGMLCLNLCLNTLCAEACYEYEEKFPTGTRFPSFFSHVGDDEAYRDIGLSTPEIDWLECKGYRLPPAEEAWQKPFFEHTRYATAWVPTLDALLPVLDAGGEEAALARRISRPLMLGSQLEEKYNRLIGE